MRVEPITPVYVGHKLRNAVNTNNFNDMHLLAIMKRCEEIHDRIKSMSISREKKEKLFEKLADFTETLIN